MAYAGHRVDSAVSRGIDMDGLTRRRLELLNHLSGHGLLLSEQAAVLQDVGNRAGLLVFGVKYKRDFSMFVVTALNARAREWVPKSTACTERDYVRLLYEIRGRTMPADMFPAAPQQPLF